jgi:hypothetical protein
MSVGVMEDYKIRDLGASHTLLQGFFVFLFFFPASLKETSVLGL